MNSAGATIGPNAILQLLPVLDDQLGRSRMRELLESARIDQIPSGEEMIDEQDVARLHQRLRESYPAECTAIARSAGRLTGDYILEHRIPSFAKHLLKMLPATIASGLLASAIRRNAWTFVGSGRFRIVSNRPLIFEIRDNPFIRDEESDHPLCEWHSAVFSRLYNELIRGTWEATETECSATGAPSCQFHLVRTG